MNDPNDSTSSDDDVSIDSTNTDDDVAISLTFLEFCAKVRKDDPSILPEPGEYFEIRQSCEREGLELADALLENTSVTYLELGTGPYTKSSAEAMAKYVRTSKRLQRIFWCLSADEKEGPAPSKPILLFSACKSREYVAQGTRDGLASRGLAGQRGV